jgi:hypothetical protein
VLEITALLFLGFGSVVGGIAFLVWIVQGIRALILKSNQIGSTAKTWGWTCLYGLIACIIGIILTLLAQTLKYT